MHHIYFAFSIFMSYLVAQFLVASVLATNSIASKLNGVTSYPQWFKANWAITMLHFVIGFALWGIYWENPTQLCGALSKLPGLDFLARFTIPVTWATTLIYGVCANALIHIAFGLLGKKIPGLGFLIAEVPPIPGPAAKLT